MSEAVSVSPSAQLRVRKLTLFSHGVAHLELSAEIEDDATLNLTFPERHMNDVLKSLTVVDTQEGQISSISYEAPHVARIQPTLYIDRQEALTTLLQNAQGARVTVYHRETVTGTILGTQCLPAGGPRNEDGEGEKTINLVLLQHDFRIATYNLSELHGIQFEDSQVQKQLDRLMHTASTTLRAKNNKSVSITAKGSGKRSVIVNYAVESPVPKLTYRFLLKSDSATTQTVFMQGWAIVDNPTDEDLEDIDMVLVSGLPISFKHDLYDARFVQRPTEKVPTAMGPGYQNPSRAHAARQVLSKAGRGDFAVKAGNLFGAPGLQGGDSFGSAMPPKPAVYAARGASVFGAGGAPADLVGDESADMSPSFESEWEHAMMASGEQVAVAESAEVGDLFEYSIPAKVTIRARESALVPLIMGDVEGNRVDIYSHKVRIGNTLSAVRIKNTTSAAFEGGPVCVYERSRLVGEGMMKVCRPGSEQFLPYSVNLDCLAERKEEVVDGDVVSTIAVNGMFSMVKAREHVTRYMFKNNKAEEVVLYVLHDIRAAYSSSSATTTTQADGGQAGGDAAPDGVPEVDLKPVEIHQRIARYRLCIPGGHRAVLRVNERKREISTQQIRSACTVTCIGLFKEKNVIGKETARKMEEIMGMEMKLGTIRAEVGKHTLEIQRLEKSQGRFRANLGSLGGLHESNKFRDDPMIQQFMTGLAESESRIEKVEEELRAAEKEEREMEKKVREKIADFGKEDLRNL